MTATPTERTYVANGFKHLKPNNSAGMKATCVSGLVPVNISAVNTKLLLVEPDNQYNVTQFIQNFAQANTTIISTVNGGPNTISGTYDISATLCWPAGSSIESVHTLQVLVHGLGLDKSYWDISPGYSYVDAAASTGYATLAYDRLGVGASDHPDPIQVVQVFVDGEIQHALVTLARLSRLIHNAFKTVVGVGHSYGSVVSLAHTAKHRKDFDAVILTGMSSPSSSLQYFGPTVLATCPAVAVLNNPAEWGLFHMGTSSMTQQFYTKQPFFRYPYFDINGRIPSRPS